MATWNRVTAGDKLYDVRKRGRVVYEVRVVSMDSVTETAQCSWNHNKPRMYTRRQLEKLHVRKPSK